MKYSLTVHDLTASQVTDIINRVEGETKITTTRHNVITGTFVPPIGSPEAIAAAQNTAAVDSVLNASTDQLLQSNKTDERDSAGLPWDERIHSGSKKKNADGKWKLRKNVDDAVVKSVEAGFLSRELPPVNASVTVPPTVPVTLVANVIPPAPVAAPVMMQAPTRDFAGLMLQISKLFASKQITPDYPVTIVNRVNAGFKTDIKTLTDVANDPRMVEYSWQCLDVDGKAA